MVKLSIIIVVLAPGLFLGIEYALAALLGVLIGVLATGPELWLKFLNGQKGD